jgi:hypothetical protein
LERRPVRGVRAGKRRGFYSEGAGNDQPEDDLKSVKKHARHGLRVVMAGRIESISRIGYVETNAPVAAG